MCERLSWEEGQEAQYNSQSCLGSWEAVVYPSMHCTGHESVKWHTHRQTFHTHAHTSTGNLASSRLHLRDAERSPLTHRCESNCDITPHADPPCSHTNEYQKTNLSPHLSYFNVTSSKLFHLCLTIPWNPSLLIFWLNFPKCVYVFVRTFWLSP